MRELGAAQQELNTKEAVELGLARKGAEAIVAQANAVAKLKWELGELQGKRAAVAVMPRSMWTREMNPETLDNQISQKQSQVSMGTQSLDFLQKQQTYGHQMTTFLNDWIEKTTSLSSISERFFTQIVDSFNDQVVKMMTTQYHRGDWKNAMKPAFTGLAKSGLEAAEGSIMKMFGLGGGGKLGTRGNPMFVQMANASAAGAAGGLLSLFGGSGGSTPSPAAGGASATAGGAMAMIAAVAKFSGFMAEGGIMSPGGFYLTGERGPELVQVGSTAASATPATPPACLAAVATRITTGTSTPATQPTRPWCASRCSAAFWKPLRI